MNKLFYDYLVKNSVKPENIIKFAYSPYSCSMVVDEQENVLRDNNLPSKKCGDVFADIFSVDPNAIPLIRSN